MSSMSVSGKEKKNELLFVGFNQDQGCFACGTDKGFTIFNCEPFKERFKREFEKPSGIGIVEMLFRCNILALVGGGTSPKYPANKVMIWDDYQNKCIAELEFRTEVKAVKLRRDRIVVALENKVYVYNFADLQLMHQLETCPNPKGIMALSPSSNSVLAVPGIKPGTIHIELFDLKHKQIIQAHNNGLTQIVLNNEGTRLASASEKGTLIRIFDTKTGDMLKELRRGADKAEIYSLAFNPASSWLACLSDKGTVHIYGLSTATDAQLASQKEREAEKTEAKTRTSSLSFMKDILPSYFSSEWSFAQFHIPEARAVLAFGPERNKILVVSSDGTYYIYSFDPEKGGEAKQEVATKFLKL